MTMTTIARHLIIVTDDSDQMDAGPATAEQAAESDAAVARGDYGGWIDWPTAGERAYVES